MTTNTGVSPSATGAADHITDSGLYDLSRIRDTARSISNRVRQALAPERIQPLRVLVVDDYPDAADALAVVVELLGCSVQVCLNGADALQAAEEFEPQVCLIDLVMPGMDGLELASRLKARTTSRPLLLVATTALGDEQSQALTALAGFHAHLIKPIDALDLIVVLHRLGGLFGDSSS